jgi:multiple sugar transport system permease protein
LVVTIIGALRSFDLISIMTNGGPFGSSPRAGLLHVRGRAVGIRLPHGLWRGHRRGAVPDHAVFIAYFLWSMWREERSAR